METLKRLKTPNYICQTCWWRCKEHAHKACAPNTNSAEVEQEEDDKKEKKKTKTKTKIIIMKMANGKESSKMLVWTDEEVALLLRLTLEYKSSKLKVDVDWESCKSKYEDITDLFEAQYPKDSTEKDFPHDVKTISKGQVTSKIKNIRKSYRNAVDDGRRSGHGRVVLIYFELCEQIWGGSPATHSIDVFLEAGGLEDLEDYSPQSSPESEDNLPPVVVKQRTDLLQAKLNNHRGDHKRKVLATPLEEEDLQIKRRMLALMEENSRRNSDIMTQINTNIANITSTVQDGFSLMREILLQPNSSNLQGRYANTPVNKDDMY